MNSNARSSLYFKVLLFAALGALYFFLLAVLWGQLWRYSPVFHWALDNLAGTAWFYPLVWCHDLLINVVLCLPLAWLILRVQAHNFILLLAVAVLPTFFYSNWPLLGSTNWSAHGLQLIGAWIMQLAMLPLAFLSVHLLARWRYRRGNH